MNYAKIKSLDISNGSGISCSIFFSGCTHKCEGCFNEEIQDFKYGEEFTNEIMDDFISKSKNSYVKNICILGGEPFQQDLEILYLLVKNLKEEVNKPIWVWTGYKWGDLIQDENKLKILKYIDILVDGQFEINKKDLKLKFKGSSNQRVINVKESLNQSKLIEIK